MEYTYQKLSSTNVSLAKQLLKVFADAFNDPASYQSDTPSNEYLELLLLKPDCIALVAMQEGNVVGGLIAYVLQKFEQERSEIYIYDLAVSEAHRRKGIATHLIQELQRTAKELGAYVIYVQADTGDTPAIALYDKLGKKENVYHFDIEV